MPGRREVAGLVERLVLGLLLVLLAGTYAAAQQPAPSSSGCVLRSSQASFAGSPPPTLLFGRTNDECQRSCQQEASCVAVGFNVYFGNCLLLRPENLAAGNWNAGLYFNVSICSTQPAEPSQSPSPLATRCNEVTAAGKKAMFGTWNGVRKLVFGLTVEQCDASCQRDESCGGFSYWSRTIPECYHLALGVAVPIVPNESTRTFSCKSTFVYAEPSVTPAPTPSPSSSSSMTASPSAAPSASPSSPVSTVKPSPAPFPSVRPPAQCSELLLSSRPAWFSGTPSLSFQGSITTDACQKICEVDYDCVSFGIQQLATTESDKSCSIFYADSVTAYFPISDRGYHIFVCRETANVTAKLDNRVRTIDPGRASIDMPQTGKH
jgi:hypothetical protein